MIGEYKNINWPTYDEKYFTTKRNYCITNKWKKRALFNVKKSRGNELFEQIKNDNKLLKYIEGINIKNEFMLKTKS